MGTFFIKSPWFGISGLFWITYHFTCSYPGENIKKKRKPCKICM